MSAFKEWLKKAFDSEKWEKFAEIEEKRVYGDDLPGKPKVVAGQVVIPENRELDIETIAQVFAGDGYKGPGPNFGRIGDLFDKDIQVDLGLDWTSGDLMNNLREQNKELFEHARRGNLSIEDMVELAERQGFNEISKKALLRKPGDMMSAEELVGGFLILRKLSFEMRHGAEQILNMPDFLKDTKSNSGTVKMIEDFEKVQRMMGLYMHISAQISGGASEAGRALGVVSHIEKVLDVDTNILRTEGRDITKLTLDNMMDDLAIKKIKMHMTNLATLDFRSQDEYVKTTWKLPKYTMDVMMESYINALLSSPTTHMVNIAGNAVFQGTRLLETSIAGYIGDARTFVRDKLGIKNPVGDRSMHIETEAFMYGTLMAQKDALKLMAKTMITGKSSDLHSKLDIDRLGIGTTNNVVDIAKDFKAGNWGRPMLNSLGVINRLSGRFLAVEDEYFKVMIRRRVQYQEAFRKQALTMQLAIKNGMSKSEAMEEGKLAYTLVMTDPDQATLELMKKTSLEETFQNPMDPRNQKIGHIGKRALDNNFSKIMGIPFYKTPMNIFQQIGDRTISPLIPWSSVNQAIKKQMSGQGGGREFDVAMSKLVTGWGTVGMVIALTKGMYGDELIITGTGPGNRKARDIINKGANIPSTSIGFKQDDGTYKFYSFNRFDPLSMLLVAGADYNNYAEYHPDSPMLEKMAHVLTLATTEYASSIPFMQGLAEFSNMVGDRHQSGDNLNKRLIKWIADRGANFVQTAGAGLENASLVGPIARASGAKYPLIGATSFTATLERLSDPHASNTMLTQDQVMGLRIEDMNPIWRSWLEMLNKARSRHPLFAPDMVDAVNFWNEPLLQMDPEQLRQNGKLIQSFNPIRVQSGAYSRLDKELMRLAMGGDGNQVFSPHKKQIVAGNNSYKMTAEEYNKYVYTINYIDKNEKLPGDKGYHAQSALLPALNDLVFGGKSKDSKLYMQSADDTRFNMLANILSDRRSYARDHMFQTGRLSQMKIADSP